MYITFLYYSNYIYNIKQKNIIISVVNIYIENNVI